MCWDDDVLKTVIHSSLANALDCASKSSSKASSLLKRVEEGFFIRFHDDDDDVKDAAIVLRSRRSLLPVGGGVPRARLYASRLSFR